MIEHMTLPDGREMIIRPAERSDAQAIAAAHLLPRDGEAPERLYRNYYLAKSLLYVRAPMAGVTTAWVGDSLAGFMFHCRDMDRLRSFARSPRSLLWLASEVLRGRFGCSPSFWITALRWGAQHFRQPHEHENSEDCLEQARPQVQAWLGTLETVEAFRRLGIGSTLFAAVEDGLRSQGAPEVAGFVAAGNVPSQRIFEKRGYELIGHYHRIGEECLLMVKPLRPDVCGGDALDQG